jgi:Ran GTPase-activating protein (RanGAP) involved in mRNA processing and transport
VLELSRCGIGNEGVANLVASGETNTSLTVLDLLGNNIHGVLGGEALAGFVLRCTNVQRLVASSNPLLRSEGVQQLCLGLLQGGQPRRPFRCLDLLHCDVGDDGVQALSASNVFASNNLEELEIRNNGITSRGLGSITSMLSRCKNMKKLTISYNRDIFNDAPTVEAFSRALSSHPSLLDRSSKTLYRSSLSLQKACQLLFLCCYCCDGDRMPFPNTMEMKTTVLPL